MKNLHLVSRPMLRIIGLILIIVLMTLVFYYLYSMKNGKLPASLTKNNFEQGKSLVSEGKYEEAIKYLEKAVNSDPSNREYQKELAVAQYNIEDYTAAISSYEQMIVVNPTDAFAYNGLANVYRDQSDTDKAIEYYQKAVGANPEFTVSYNNWAQVLVDQDKKDEAIKVLEDGIKANPGSDELKASLEIMKKQ